MNTASTAYNKSTVHFTIDFIHRKIIGTKTSFDKAGKGFGAEYEELTAKMAAHPGFEPTFKMQNTTKSKRTYDGLNFSFMEDYIGTQENAAAVMEEYKAVKQMAEKCGTKVYPLTKKWFLSKFSPKDAPFDMGKAKDEIDRYRFQEAENCSKGNENSLDEAC